MINCKQLKKYAILFAVLSLLPGCGGLKIDSCTVDAPSVGMQCVSETDKEFFLSFQLTANYVCLNPNDIAQVLRVCRMNREQSIMLTGPNVSVCISDPPSGFQCVNEFDEASFLTLKQANNYYCTSPKGFEKLLKHCRMNGERL